jgi:hypothetical protein
MLILKKKINSKKNKKHKTESRLQAAKNTKEKDAGSMKEAVASGQRIAHDTACSMQHAGTCMCSMEALTLIMYTQQQNSNSNIRL